MRAGLLAVGMATLVSGCSDSNGPPGAQCSAPVSFSVSAGLTPTISWTPRCRLAGLFVEAVESGGDVWAIEADGSEGISSGIVYGTVPTGAAEDAPAEPLATGASYRVIGVRSTGGELVGAGVATFTP